MPYSIVHRRGSIIGVLGARPFPPQVTIIVQCQSRGVRDRRQGEAIKIFKKAGLTLFVVIVVIIVYSHSPLLWCAERVNQRLDADVTQLSQRLSERRRLCVVHHGSRWLSHLVQRHGSAHRVAQQLWIRLAHSLLGLVSDCTRVSTRLIGICVGIRLPCTLISN